MATPTPEGFKKDGKGRLVPIGSIKQLDLIKDEFVIKGIALAKKLQYEMAKFKRQQMSEVEEFMLLLQQEHEVRMGGKKGNITLRSFDQSSKIVVQNQDRIELGPELILAKSIIDELLEEWTQGSSENLVTLITKKFQTDNQGQVSPGEVLSLRNYEIEDPSGRWEKAMELIAQSISVVGSSRFIRFYEKDDNEVEQPISLDISKL